MARIIVLFNLQDGADVNAYEAWAKSTDLPIVRGLDSVNSFEVQRVAALFGSDDPAPYQYIEIIDVDDLDLFGKEVGTETMQKVAGEFQSFADNPAFLLTHSLED